MSLKNLAAYELILEKKLKDIDSTGYLLKHKKTGARIALISNSDTNKVFNIGFRTPPTDSTGVAHIIEHSVLCGSKEFPVKDPFVELVKGSLNTFLNAMTYPDKTIYPVASCNDKDFQNLMHVYLDAVFFPNIYREENIFRQEGWHYEMESLDDELKINGVVYNEMKGAFSSPDDVNYTEINKSLYPDTTYFVVSGGDPKCIPDLSYEQFLDFHSRYYHPSNSYIYLYGDMDMEEKLIWMDEHYLSKFDYLEIDSAVAKQKAFEKPVRVYKEYPILEEESLEQNTYLSYNTVVSTSLDMELVFAFDLIDYCLCSSSGAPIKNALIHKGIGTEVYGEFMDEIYQPSFSIVAKNADAEQLEEFIATIEEELQKAVTQGIDRQALLAALNANEFRYREADYGSYPKGLMYGLDMLDTWLYDENMPFAVLEANAVYQSLRDKLDTDYFEKLVETYLLHNTHKSYVVVAPKAGLTQKEDEELAGKLKAYKDSLTKEELAAIVDATHALKKYQETEDAPEDIAKIPLLAREDLKKEAEPFVNELREEEKVKILFHNVKTNGIGYMRFMFDARNVPQELFRYFVVLKNVLGYVDTTQHSYGDLYNELNIHTGGVNSTINTYVDAKNLDAYKLTFEIKAKAFYREFKDTISLITEIITESNLQDTNRILELISEVKSRMQGNMTNAGHSVAAIRSMAYFSEIAAVVELVSGVPALRLLESLETNFEEEKEELVEKLTQLSQLIFRPENLMLDLTCDEEGYQIFVQAMQTLLQALNTSPVEKKAFQLSPSKKNEAFLTSGTVQYVAASGNFMKQRNLPYTGALSVLKVIMGYEYLWTNIRVKGGAYGCMCSFGKNGDSYFVSYRDPNLKKTIDTYLQIADYLRTFLADETVMTKYIIGTLSEIDTPLTPSAVGSRSQAAFLSNVSFEDIQRERDQILNCNQEDIRKLADYMEAILEEEAICVVGCPQAIEENKELFLSTDHLFH